MAHFLINPGARAKSRRRRTRVSGGVAKRRRRRKVSRRITSSRGSTMARRRRRRVAAIRTHRRRRRRHATVARRRRRNPGALGAARRANPRRRRRVHARRHARRRYRRNPGIIGSSRGIVGGIMQGLKDGAAVVGGQVVTRKVSGAVTGMLPASTAATVATGPGKIALSLASAVITAMIARRVLPGQARLITAGAFSETINCALAQSPIAPFLSAYPMRRTNPRVAAYPGTGSSRLIGAGPRMAAWPTMRVVGLPSHVGS
jgi:hypothetical protein